MKNIQVIHQNLRNLPAKTGMGHQIESSFQFAREACLRAIDHLNGSRQMCVIAGQMLRELRDRCAHGEFMPLIEEHIPEVSHQTVLTWIRAAEAVTRYLK